MTELEPRENPAIPVGLTEVPSLILGSNPPPGYEETHSLTRDETITVTVDQSGTGSDGTFTIDIIGSAESGDTAEGEGGSNGTSVTASGTKTEQFSYHATITGEYADGAFTITGHTYDASGWYSLSQNTARTNSDPDFTPLTEWDVTRSGSYELSWSASVSGGQFTYTSYSFSATDTAHWHTRLTSWDGGYSDTTWDIENTISTTGSGGTATYTGTNSWHEHQYWTYPDPNGGTPIEGSSDSGFTDPVSGSAALPPPSEPTSEWQWRAGTPDATSFTFHGEASESASLTESATYRVTEYGTEFDVNSFTSSSNWSDSGHVVDDEPGVFESGSGTTLFHRDETFSAGNEVTGSGSYVGGSADATYHAVEAGSFSVANTYTVADDYSSGYAEDGEPYELVFNYSRESMGSGSITHTHNYHDEGDGLALTGSTYVASGSSEVSSRNWGTRNGEAFDTPSETSDSMNSSFSFPGDPTPVTTADGMEEAFPFQAMVNPGGVFFSPQANPQQMQQPPIQTSPNKIQDWYNKKIKEVGAKGASKAAKIAVKQEVMQAINDTPNGGRRKGSGTFTIDSGGTFSVAIGRDGEVATEDGKRKQYMRGEQGYKDVELVATKVEFTYAVDGAAQPPPRSGNVVVEYKVLLFYKAKNKAGQVVSPVRVSVVGIIQFHDGNLETADLQP